MKISQGIYNICFITYFFHSIVNKEDNVLQEIVVKLFIFTCHLNNPNSIETDLVLSERHQRAFYQKIEINAK